MDALCPPMRLRELDDINLGLFGLFELLPFSIYTLGDLGVLSNLIGSLSVAN